MPNQHYDDPDEDEEIEEHYGEDGSEKGAPEYFSMRDEAAVFKKSIMIKVHKHTVIQYWWTSLGDIG